MKMIMKILLILSMGIFLAGCNEKISPALEAGNSSTTVPTAVEPDEYYFRVKNKSNSLLGYVLHRTGSAFNPLDPKCEIKSTTKLSNTAYYSDSQSNPAHDNKTYDITCFFEAEELSLNFSGFEFDIEASPNTCAYVGYTPFSFYDYKPGNSSTTYTKLTCPDDITPSGITLGKANALGQGADLSHDLPAAGTIGCNEYVDTGFVGTGSGGTYSRQKLSVADEDELCRFNYENRKCDEGLITVQDWVITYTAATDTDPETATSSLTTRIVKCGGDHLNCVNGPIKELTDFTAAAFTEVYNTELNEKFEKSYKYEGTFPHSNRKYVNFRKNLANPEIDFEDSTSLLAFYASDYIFSFGTNTSFQPLVLDLYTRNKLWNKITPIISANDILDETYVNGYTAKPYAAEPYLGLDGHRTNPFYTFYCFDQAFDIRAKIRMMVREWDRTFPTTSTTLTYLSDIGYENDARQDYPVGYLSENPGDPDEFNAYNDIMDWDDYLFMTRTPGPIAGTTMWEPKTGWFDSNLFQEY